MIPVRYSLARWVIFAVGAVIASLYYFLFPVGLQVLFGFLLILTAMSWIVPPGIFGRLLHAVCPTCGKSVEWEAVQPEGLPYQEQIVIRCKSPRWSGNTCPHRLAARYAAKASG